LRFSPLCCCLPLGRRAAKRMVYNNAFENGRSQASLRSLARAVQRGR
jgi:hypothetical protein